MGAFMKPTLTVAKPRGTSLALLTLLVVSGGLMAYTAWTDSPIMDELPHIPAGYTYLTELDFRLNPEHPPLLKALAALPLLAERPHFPTNDPHWTESVNAQWDLGRIFLYRSGNDADAIIRLARIVPVLLSLLLIFLVFRVSRELMGPRWALLPTALVAFSPTMLAHGHYVTTDLGAAFGAFLALTAFAYSLQNPTRGRIIAAGLAFGVAQLLKFSLVMLIPLFGALALVWGIAHAVRASADTVRPSWRAQLGTVMKPLGTLILVMAVGFVLVYLVYLLFTWHYPVERQLSDTITILTDFESSRWVVPYLTPLVTNPIIKPFAEYLLGVSMVFVRASGGNTGYFLGAVTNKGWWFYFPLSLLMKETVGFLVLVAGGLLAGAAGFLASLLRGRRVRRAAEWLGTNFLEFSFLSFAALYWAASITSPLNIGVRHVLPTLPLLAILAVRMLKLWLMRRAAKAQNPTLPDKASRALPPALAYATATPSRALTTVAVALAVWHAGAALAATPYHLSYFNEAFGGTRNGYRYAVDSNYDWGQDLWRFRDAIGAYNRAHPDDPIRSLAIDFFGGDDPTRVLSPLGIEVTPWWPAKGDPREIGIEWLAVSANSLQGGLGEPVREWVRPPQDSYQWLADLKPTPQKFGEVPTPDLRAGTSIFLYRL